MKRKHKYHWAFRLWIRIRAFLAFLVVCVGILVGLATLILPFDGLYKNRLESFLSDQWGLKVGVDEIQGAWKGYGPNFRLQGLTLEGKQVVEIEDTTLSLNVYELLFPGGKTGIDLSINEADLVMLQSNDGHSLTINNDQDDGKITDMVDNILATGALHVKSLNLTVSNDKNEVLIDGLKAAFLLEQGEYNRGMSLTVQQDDQPSLVVKSIGSKSQQFSKDARWHIQLNDFDLSYFNELKGGRLLPAVVINGGLWVNTNQGIITDASGTLNWQFKNLTGQLDWRHQGENKQWSTQFKLSHLTDGNEQFHEVNSQLSRTDKDLVWVADDIDMAWVNRLLSSYLPEWPDLEVAGKLPSPTMTYDLSAQKWLDAELNFELTSVLHQGFSLSNLSGQAALKEQSVSLLLEGHDGHFEMPGFVRGKLEWIDLLAQISWPLKLEMDQYSSLGHSPNQNAIRVNQFWCDCLDFDADAQGQYWVADLSQTGATEWAKLLQLQAKVTAVDVAALYKFWPHEVWSPKTISWLDVGLKAGQVETGYIFQYGQLIPKAFENGLANFISRAYLKDVSVKFNPEWPLATDLSGVAIFTGLGFDVDVDGAKSLAIEMTSADVSMASYKQAFIDLSLTAKAAGNSLFDYLSVTPVTKNVSIEKDLKLSGHQIVDLKLDIPLGQDMKVVPKGQVTFNNAGFSTAHMALTKLNGQVVLDGFDLLMDGLAAELLENPVSISGEINTKTQEGLKLDVDLLGEMSAAELMALQQIDLPIYGTSQWLINISNPNKQLHMGMESDLVGTTVELPAPLNKPPESDKVFKFDCAIPCSDSTIGLNYGDEIISRLNSSDSGLIVEQLQFKKPEAVSQDGLLLGGEIAYLNVDKWLQQVSEWRQDKGVETEGGQPNAAWPLPSQDFSFVIDEMLFMARRFHDVKIRVLRQVSGYEIDVETQLMKGHLIIADDLASQGIVADFDHLYWNEVLAKDLIQSGQSAEKLPDLHIFAKEFRYLDIPFGELRLEMRNVIDGMRVETLSLVSELNDIQISGDWVASANGGLGVSDFSIVMTSEKIAEFLGQLNFEAPITNAQTLIQLYASWPGTPTMFDLKNINGILNLKMGEGEVLDTKPGFGRVLGLFSLTNLPRRLLLDFKDVMADGLHFDSMQGHFVLNNGYAETEDFIINASAANIKVEGLTGFADKSYHQTIVIEPQVGKTFPTIGAIAGGAVGAAAGFFVQGILNKKLKSSNRISYLVTGTWDTPIIKVIEDE